MKFFRRAIKNNLTLFLILNLAQAVLLKNENTEVLFSEDEIQEATKVVEIPVE